jgi:hypothetical protein
VKSLVFDQEEKSGKWEQASAGGLGIKEKGKTHFLLW